jgi:hypothetical protein
MAYYHCKDILTINQGRQTMKKLALLFSLVFLAGVSFGALDVYEPFDYSPVGSTLVGQSGAVGTSGAWSENAAATTYITNGLTYTGLATAGNAAYMDASGGDSIMEIAHTAPGWGSGVKYMSWLYRETAYGGHAYMSGGGSYNGACGHAWSTTWGINNVGKGVGYSAETTYFLVAKIDWTGGMTHLWVDPPSLAVEPAIGDTVADKAETQETADIWVNTYNTDGTWDEIRIGDTYQDVTGVPEPAFGIIAMIGMVALRFRK